MRIADLQANVALRDDKTAQIKKDFNVRARNIHRGCFVYTGAAK
jgi:hypothetical protein